MLPKRIIVKPQITSTKNFGKYCQRKQVHSTSQYENDDKENQQNSTNIQHVTVDVCKKIRKRSPRKSSKICDERTKIERFHGFVVFKEEELGMDPEFMAMIQPQRIDNDVDTDE